MSPGPNPEELFEDHYTDVFRQRFARHGLIVRYERDRAGRDIGLDLVLPGTLELSGVRVWFQLKGRHTQSLPADVAAAAEFVDLDLPVKQLQFWYAAPEATYLIVYVESLDCFLGEDVREIVDRQWGAELLRHLADAQKTVRVKVPMAARLTEERVAAMLQHRSIRIDGPSWRGRPLGHRLDPLRSELEQLTPDTFDAVVDDVLDVHGFRIEQRLDPNLLLEGVDGTEHRARLLVGTFFSTLEWVPAMTTEIGFDDDSSGYRIEGSPFHAHGPTAVLIHSKVPRRILASSAAISTVMELAERDIGRLVVFANASDYEVMGAYRKMASQLWSPPLGLAALAGVVLVATNVYFRHLDQLVWKYVNYNLTDVLR